MATQDAPKNTEGCLSPESVSTPESTLKASPHISLPLHLTRPCHAEILWPPARVEEVCHTAPSWARDLGAGQSRRARRGLDGQQADGGSRLPELVHKWKPTFSLSVLRLTLQPGLMALSRNLVQSSVKAANLHEQSIPSKVRFPSSHYHNEECGLNTIVVCVQSQPMGSSIVYEISPRIKCLRTYLTNETWHGQLSSGW